MNALSLSEGPGHIIAEHASAGGVQKEYIWLGDTPLAVFEGANLYYVHPDNLDRPVMMTNNNATQTIAWAARYDPFGNAVTVTSAITNNQRLPAIPSHGSGRSLLKTTHRVVLPEQAPSPLTVPDRRWPRL